MKCKVVVLTGMSCAGKDTVRRALEKIGYTNIVSHTSRPMRENEIEGIDYNFVSKEEFNNLIDNNEMIEYRNYETNWNGRGETWFYGVKKFKPKNVSYVNYVIVMDLMGAESIIRHFGEENCIVVYLYASDEIRKRRAIKRGSFDETEWNRRLITDYKDFSFANLNSFMHRHKVWQIDNDINDLNEIEKIANVIDFIRWGRLS